MGTSPACWLARCHSRDQDSHCPITLIHGRNQGVRRGRKAERIPPLRFSPVEHQIVIVYERFALPVCSAPWPAGMGRIVEACKEFVQIGGLVPPNDKHAIEFSGRAVGMNLIY